MNRVIKNRSFSAIVKRISTVVVFLLVMLLAVQAEHAQAEKTAQPITVGSEIDFPPYAIVDDKGRASGFSVELLEAVADAMGLSVKVSSGPWSDVLAAFKAGKYDVLPLVALSATRADMGTYK